MSLVLLSLSRADRLVIAKRQTEHIMNERRLLGMCRHTFLPHLVATFQDKTQIFVLMDLILGGEVCYISPTPFVPSACTPRLALMDLILGGEVMD